MMKKWWISCAAMCLAMTLGLCAGALAMDAQSAQGWTARFAASLSMVSPRNDPEKTMDPARAGEMLLEYEFGTVIAGAAQRLTAEDIFEIDLRTSQVADCRGVRVGMGLDAALDGVQPLDMGAQLYVLSVGESGWSWAHMNEGGVYGVEYIVYSADGSKEYRLTYVITDGAIKAIRTKMASATQAQAQDGLATAREMLERQEMELIAVPNAQPAFGAGDLIAQGGGALGVPVASLVTVMGEPQEIQSLPEGGGRLLIYDGAAVRLALHAQTGEEVVRALSVSSDAIAGPRGLVCGMRALDATALFACEAAVTKAGGTMYLHGEAAGDAPYGEAIALEGGEEILTYACIAAGGETALLRVGVSGKQVRYWQLVYESDEEGGV